MKGSDVSLYNWYSSSFVCMLPDVIFLQLCTLQKKDLLEIGVNVVDWIGLAQDRYRWRALVNSVMNLRVP
jgi:hypothetical protein